MQNLRTLFLVAIALGGLIGTTQAQFTEEEATRARHDSVRRYLESGIMGRTPVRDKAVLEAMRTVPRHLFVPAAYRDFAYVDHPQPIGNDQTISQPYIVATMTEVLHPDSDDIVLEVGTGSGYQAAVLAEIVKEVYTIEIVPALGERSKKLLRELGYENVHVRIGDGYQGWLEHAPFDAIIVTAAPNHVPQPLLDQLKPGGRMVIPVGNQGEVQLLKLFEKNEDGSISEIMLERVRFVPMTGEALKN